MSAYLKWLHTLSDRIEQTAPLGYMESWGDDSRIRFCAMTRDQVETIIGGLGATIERSQKSYGMEEHYVIFA